VPAMQNYDTSVKYDNFHGHGSIAASRELTFNALKAVRKRAAFLCA
jgi:hypothetical protein